MLRHALQLGYHDVSLQLHEAAGLLDAAHARGCRGATAVHPRRASSRAVSESRYELLYDASRRSPAAPEVSVGDFIGSSLDELAPR